MSSAWKVQMFRIDSPATPPAVASGTENMMTSGNTKLSNRIAMTR